ncbi:uncharacterized protein B0I36DRAFT_313720 [Microdochium trichocladiopsis]|uniref:Uncharacterized protein n=1 Tax=Microdochium trichocladiopsis TaxID=1682393 RepID=A0A9P8YEA1_9PEZI|nr:uncharacterized protein B0I36DRAFT_313720 [Microdochium trichocladiopsis]KAH7037297.1 hypothetical protein B0I36DRAFT_313720 [Microdochium trichocladiopsis]
MRPDGDDEDEAIIDAGEIEDFHAGGDGVAVVVDDFDPNSHNVIEPERRLTQIPFKLEPISGATLYELEHGRRSDLWWQATRRRRRDDDYNLGGQKGGGAVVGEEEVGRGAERPPLRLGCTEIDDQVLLGGGFERGAVFGVSSEDVEFGMAVGLQALARDLVFTAAPASSTTAHDSSGHSAVAPKAAIITSLPASAILGPLQKAIRAQVLRKRRTNNDDEDQEGASSNGVATPEVSREVNSQVRACLGRVSISRVFDIVGLWQVLDEIEAACRSGGPPDNGRPENGSMEVDEHRHEDADPISSQGKGGDRAAAAAEAPRTTAHSPPASQRLPSPATSLPPLRPPLPMRAEISDSEDDDEALSSPPAHLTESSGSQQDEAPGATGAAGTPPVDDDRASEGQHDSEDDQRNSMPDMILVTHFSTLLSTLFTQSGTDRAAAHTTLQLLSTHLRYLACSSGSVIVLLNTTATNDTNRSTSATNTNADATTMNASENMHNRSSRPLDPTLRSIFNPTPMAAAAASTSDAGVVTPARDAGAGRPYGGAGNMLSRRNKPTFGLTFAQFLDVHLLCTRLPRTREDAERMVSASTRRGHDHDTPEEVAVTAVPRRGRAVEYCWAVEVLLDELDVWATDSPGGKARRVNREQRWGAVQVSRVSGLIENAFDGSARRYQELVDQGPIRLAAGFGGRRV